MVFFPSLGAIRGNTRLYLTKLSQHQTMLNKSKHYLTNLLSFGIANTSSFFANTIPVSSYYGTASFVFGWYHHIITVPIVAIFRKTSMLGYPNFKTVFLIYDKVNERVYT
jgi:hypothetical protein